MVIKFKNEKEDQPSQRPRAEARVTAALLTIIVLLVSLIAVSLFLGLEAKFCGNERKNSK